MLTTNCLLSRLGLLAMALSTVDVALGAQASGENAKVTFAAGRRESTFGFDWHNGMIFIPVCLNGSRPLSFVLDSGSARTIVDRALATSLGLKASGSGSLQGAGAGRVPIEFIHDVSIALPGVESTGHELSAADLQPLEASLGVRVDGIIGYELLSRFVVTVDYEAKTLTLNLPGSFHASNAGASNPDRATRQVGFCESRACIAGTRYRARQLSD
jgi:hypothetical protein